MRISTLKAPAFLAVWYLLCGSLLAPAVAQSSKSATASSLFKRLAKSQTRESVLGPGFTSIDTNGDGLLSLDELEAGQLLMNCAASENAPLASSGVSNAVFHGCASSTEEETQPE